MKFKNLLAIAALFGMPVMTSAEGVNVDTLRYAGPYVLRQPLMIDSTDVKSNKFDAK